GDGVELHWRRPAGAHPFFHVHREIAQVEIAGTDLNPGVGDADERLLKVGLREANCPQHCPGTGSMGPGSQGIGSGRAHEAASVMSEAVSLTPAISFSRVFQLA